MTSNGAIFIQKFIEENVKRKGEKNIDENMELLGENDSHASFDDEQEDDIVLGGYNPAFESQVSSIISLSDGGNPVEKKGGNPCCQRALRRENNMKLKKKQLGSDADCESDSSETDGGSGAMTMAKRRGSDDFSDKHSHSSSTPLHCHDSSDERDETERRKKKLALKKLIIATVLSTIFMIGEVVGGYLANSLAVMTDASHLLTDVSSFVISILALIVAQRPVSKKMTFGWHRAEIIGALISVVAIWIVTGVLVYEAAKRVINRDYEVNGKVMLITASIAVGFNIIMGLVLHEHSHVHGLHSSHSHGHDHDDDEESGHGHGHHHHNHAGDSGNVNVRAAFIHVIGDLLQSLGVLAAAFIIYFKPEYKLADPICTFIFSLLVLFTTIAILRDTMVVVMEGTPVGIEYSDVKEKLMAIEGVTAIHDLRIWSLTLNQVVMSAHLAVDRAADPNTVLHLATQRLKMYHDFHSLTLQVEYYSEEMDDCKQCQPAK